MRRKNVKGRKNAKGANSRVCRGPGPGRWIRDGSTLLVDAVGSGSAENPAHVPGRALMHGDQAATQDRQSDSFMHSPAVRSVRMRQCYKLSWWVAVVGEFHWGVVTGQLGYSPRGPQEPRSGSPSVCIEPLNWEGSPLTEWPLPCLAELDPPSREKKGVKASNAWGWSQSLGGVAHSLSGPLPCLAELDPVSLCLLLGTRETERALAFFGGKTENSLLDPAGPREPQSTPITRSCKVWPVWSCSASGPAGCSSAAPSST